RGPRRLRREPLRVVVIGSPTGTRRRAGRDGAAALVAPAPGSVGRALPNGQKHSRPHCPVRRKFGGTGTADGRSLACCPFGSVFITEPRTMPEGKSKARRSLGRIRPHRGEDERSLDEGRARAAAPSGPPSGPLNDRGEVGWDHNARLADDRRDADDRSPLTAQILSLFSEPAVTTITAISAARALERPRT